MFTLCEFRDSRHTGVMRLHVEMKDIDAELILPNDGADLAAFLSFANLRGFGATHPLIALADRLHDQHHVAMGPLTIFYGRDIEDDEDAEKLEKAWQPAGPLADSLDSVCTAFETDVQVLALARRADAGGLGAQLDAVRTFSRGAALAGKAVRLSFSE